jgi:hypothetical protein
MNCKECKENLSALIDGELEKRENKNMLDHLLTCTKCSEELRSLLTVDKIVKKHSSEIVPDKTLWQNIKSQLKPKKKVIRNPLAGFLNILTRQPVFLKRLEIALLAVFALFAFLYFTNSQFIISKQEISLRFKTAYPEFRRTGERAYENLTRKELLILINEMMSREELNNEERPYKTPEQRKENNEFLFENRLGKNKKDYTQFS